MKPEDLSELRSTLENISAIDAKSLTERPEMGELSLSDVTTDVANTINMAKEYCTFSLEFLPPGQIDNMRGAAGNFLRETEGLLNFSINNEQVLTQLRANQSPKEIQVRKADSLRSSCHEFYNAFAQGYGYLKFHSPEIQQKLQQSTEFLELAKQQLKGELEKAEKSSKEIGEILETARKAVTGTGVEKHAGTFGGIANSHKRMGYWWLGATFLLIAAVAVISWCFISHNLPEGSLNSAALSTGQKLNNFIPSNEIEMLKVRY